MFRKLLGRAASEVFSASRTYAHLQSRAEERERSATMTAAREQAAAVSDAPIKHQKTPGQAIVAMF
jgi:hypothetical protein